MAVLCRIFDFLRGPRVFQFFWHLLARVSKLSQAEQDAASAVLGLQAIDFSRVRIAEGRILSLFFKLNKHRAFTTFQTVNLPSSGSHLRTNLAIVVHELTHVFQFEKVGSVYIPQALRAQRTEGYGYGGVQGLVQDWAGGKRLRGYNREQQAQIAQDYFATVVARGDAAEPAVRQAYQPFIEEMRQGLL
jgi:hypothetical protein